MGIDQELTELTAASSFGANDLLYAVIDPSGTADDRKLPGSILNALYLLDSQLTPTKGNVIIANGSNFIVVGVGANDELLTADSGEASGVKWAAIAEVSILQIQVFS